MNTEKFDAVLVGGLDYRPGDKNIGQQVELLKSGFGTDKNIKGFKYNTPTSEVINFLKDNPDIPVFLFSAGCKKANQISSSGVANNKKIFIIEPCASDNCKNTRDEINKAVPSKIPSSNVFVGKGPSTGYGVVTGAQSSGGSNHWDALRSVGQKMKGVKSDYTQNISKLFKGEKQKSFNWKDLLNFNFNLKDFFNI